MPTATAPAALLTGGTRITRSYAPSGAVGRHLAAAQALQLEIDALTAKLSIHREWLFDHMERRNLDRLELNNFQAVRKSRANWAYTPSTEREMLALRTTQKWEQQQGCATNNPTRYIALSTVAPKP